MCFRPPLRSASFFNTVKATSSSAAVSVITTPSATAGTITINSIRPLATSQKITGTQPASKALSGTLQSETPGTLPESEIIHLADSLAGKSISLNLDGKVKVVTFDSEFFMNVIENPSAETLENAFQAAVDKAFGVIDPQDRIINVSINEDQLSFAADGSRLTVRAVGDDEKRWNCSGSNGQSNKINTGLALGDISFARELDDVETFKFSINSVEFEFDDPFSYGNNEEDQRKRRRSDPLLFTPLPIPLPWWPKTGAGENIKIEQTQGNLMEALGLTAESGASVVYGQNALLTVNGKDIVRSTNEINIDGVTIQLHQTTEEDADPITITLENDATSLKEPIKKFVEDYNALMDLINGLVKEAVYGDYQPLSEEQKSEMTRKRSSSGRKRPSPVSFAVTIFDRISSSSTA